MNGFRILPLLACSALLWSEGVEAGQSEESILEAEVGADADEEADSKESGEGSKEPEARAPKALAIGATLVPGVLVHGAGSWVDGDSETAMRLLEMEGAGLGMILAGGVPIALTGASRYIIGPAAAVTIVGFGLFTVSWAADVYAVTAPQGGWGAPRTLTPFIETEVGYRHVYDPRFDYRHFMVNRVDVRHGPFRLAPVAFLGANNTRLRLLGGYRVFGPMATASSRASDGSALDLEAAVTRHDYRDDAFAIDTWELFVRSRTDLDRLAKPLLGSFLELGLGGAVQRYSYDLPGPSIPSDLQTMLLGRFGFGVYVGGPSAPDGEFLFYYDHRHDDYAAGLLSTLPLSGVAGHFGIDGRMFFSENWGVSAQGQIGSALVGGLSLMFREFPR